MQGGDFQSSQTTWVTSLILFLGEEIGVLGTSKCRVRLHDLLDLGGRVCWFRRGNCHAFVFVN